jgi:AcrR family transcriptional regulator
MALAITSRQSPRKRLQTAARDLFYRDGYALSLQELADRAGVAPAIVRSHFGSLDVLIASALQVAGEEWFAILDAELERRAGDPLSRLLAPFELLAADVPDADYHDCLFMYGMAPALGGVDHPARRALVTHEQRMSERFGALAAEAGAADPAMLAEQLMLLYTGLTARVIVERDLALIGQARRVATLLLHSAV